MHGTFIIAAENSDPKAFGTIFIWSAVLIALILIAFAGYSYLKRWMKQEDAPAGLGFTLSDMRELHRQGKMSDEEFEQTRAKMLAAARKVADNMAPVLPRRAGPRPPNKIEKPPVSPQ